MRLLLTILIFSGLLQAQNSILFIGSYTQSGSKGIYVYKFNERSGKLEWLTNTDSGTVVNPSYLCIAPDKKHIYVSTESKIFGGGSVSAFEFDKQSAKLKFLNKEESIGENPVHISVHKTGKWIVNANYTAGNITAYPLWPDGKIRPAFQIIQLEGAGPNKERQEKAHAHSAVFSPMGENLFVCDLGSDKIMSYNFNEYINLPIMANDPPATNCVGGSGPRHLEFHPNGQFAYCIEELSGRVSVYKYINGRLDSIQRIAAHEANNKGPFASADIHISSDGRFLYASNRASENTIAIFAIAKETGKLELIGIEPSGGKGPRNFTISPDDNYLLVANAQSGNVVVFKRNKKTGLLKRTDSEIKIPAASCLKMMLEDKK